MNNQVTTERGRPTPMPFRIKPLHGVDGTIILSGKDVVFKFCGTLSTSPTPTRGAVMFNAVVLDSFKSVQRLRDTRVDGGHAVASFEDDN